MINTKTLFYGTQNQTALKIEISYEWNNANDELVDKIIKKLPKFIEKQNRGLKKCLMK